MVSGHTHCSYSGNLGKTLRKKPELLASISVAKNVLQSTASMYSGALAFEFYEKTTCKCSPRLTPPAIRTAKVELVVEML